MQAVDCKRKPPFEPIARGILRQINKYRRRHKCPPLKWDLNMSDYATDCAIHLLELNLSYHHTTRKYGENIYRAVGEGFSGRHVARLWYNEHMKYDFQSNDFNADCGHFTQLIWKSSKKIGIGWAKLDDHFVVICNFHPPGNVYEQFRDNVPPPKKKARKKLRPSENPLPIEDRHFESLK